MRVRLSLDARNDLLTIRDHIADTTDPVIAARVVARFDAILTTLASFPSIGHDGTAKGTREMLTPRIPYVVVYRIEMTDAEDELVVLRVYHTSRGR